MNSRQRVREAIAHRQPDRVALDFAARDEVYQALMRRWGVDSRLAVEERLGVDLRCVGPRFALKTHEKAYADPSLERTPAGVYRDIWGVGFVPSRTEHGEYMELAENPLREVESVAQLDRHRWPSADWWDYSDIPEQAKACGDKWVWAHSRGIFELSWFLRGFENFLMDMSTNVPLAEAVMDRVQAYLMERTERILRAGGGGIDMMEYNDDVGCQLGLLLSPEMWRRFLKPRMAAFIRLCRKYAAAVRYHSCGGVRAIIPDLIEIGVDVLNPVQATAAGMEPTALKRDFGARLTFNGGVDTQQLLPFADAGQVRRETRRLIDVVGKGGGLILAPTHVFQGDVPLANILAVYETALGKPL